MKNNVLKWVVGIIFVLSLFMLIIPAFYSNYRFLYYSVTVVCFASLIAYLFLHERRIVNKSRVEILNDYIIIEHMEVKLESNFHLTEQDKSRLVYKDAIVKFTPKNSVVKPGDTVIYNKSMAYPYILDGKQHFIITEENIVAIK